MDISRSSIMTLTLSTTKPVQKRNIIAAAILIALGSNTAMGEGLHDGSGFTLTPSIGHHVNHNGKRNLDNSNTVSLGAGYQFASPWAAELTYLASKPHVSFSGEELDEEHLRLDALYYFDRTDKAQLYSVIGAGASQLSLNEISEDDTLLNAGLGFKYAFNDIVALRTDMRLNHYLNSDATHGALNMGLSFLIGGKAPAKPVKNVDTDRDGIADRLDSCPGTAVGIAVDSTGCPIVVDTDKDGVVDTKDNCPGTKAGAKVDAKGCYILLTEDRTVALKMQFANNAATILNPNDPQVIELVKFMREYPKTEVVIKGYTDDRGSEKYNLQLSQKRADAVGVLLSQKGIEASRVTTKGFGEASPIADNSTEQGRAQNRRVEAVVSATVEVAQ